MTSRELTFLPGQSSSNMPTSCTELEILDDIVLEDRETFSVVITSRLTEVIITSGREEAQVQIDEDDDDSMLEEFLPAGRALRVRPAGPKIAFMFSVCLYMCVFVRKYHVILLLCHHSHERSGSY